MRSYVSWVLQKDFSYLLSACRIVETISPRASNHIVSKLVHMRTASSSNQFMWATRNPNEAECIYLAHLLEKAKNTVFARDHKLTENDDMDSYRSKVPIRDYDELTPYFDRVVRGEKNILTSKLPHVFMKSSGTTGASKLIPIVYDAASASWNLSVDSIYFGNVIDHFPDVALGFSLFVTSRYPAGRTSGGVPIVSPGGASGGWLSPAVFQILDDDLRYYTILRLAAQRDVRVVNVFNPSTAVLLARKLDEYSESLAHELRTGEFSRLFDLPEGLQSVVQKQLRRDSKAANRLFARSSSKHTSVALCLWPNLRLISCWLGGSASLYRHQLSEHFPHVACWDPGYLAIEGTFTRTLEPETPSGVVNLFGQLIEFVPVDDGDCAGQSNKSFLAEQLEVGQRYRVIASNHARGLYRYNTHDIVECDGYFEKTARIRFLHRDQNTISFTGEKVTESHVIEAIEIVRQRTAIALEYCAVTAEFSDPPRYIFAIETAASLPETQDIEKIFDSALREINSEYERKRRTLRLADPKLLLLPAGTHARFYKKRLAQGAQDGRIKLPHVFRDPVDLFELAELK